LLDTLHVQRFVIGGNSLGGEVAWRTAVLAPERVERLILVDAAGAGFTPKAVPIGFLIARLPVLRDLSEHLLPRVLVAATVASVYGDPKKVNADLVDRYFELTLREGNRHALGQIVGAMEPGEGSSRIATITQPTLILWGGRDQLIPVESAQKFKAAIAGSQLVVFDALGHVPQEEDPARTVAPVKAFLQLR
jgi:pimeloyl-ACP methyl ester carboxylesterase